MLAPNVINPEILEFIMGIATGFLAKKGENILNKSTDKISDFLKKKLGKDELEKIKGLTTPDAKKKLEELIKDKNLVKEVHTFYVIYRYLEKFTADSVFLRVMDFRRGEGLLLDQMYVKLRIVEEKKEKEVLDTGRYYDEECYYRIRNRWERSERPSRTIDPDDIMDMNKGLVCILGLPGAGKTTLCKYFCWKTMKGEYTKQGLPIYVELRGVRKEEDPVTYAFYSKLKEHFTKEEIEEAVTTIKHNTELFSPLFIFDGLDEIKVDYGFISESIRNCADSSLCIVTSRRSGFIYMQHDRTYEILPLEWEEKKGFIENYFKYIGEEDKIDPFLRVLEKKEYDSISKNPMLLSILCALASDEKDVTNLPSRKSGLYKRIVVKMNEWHKSKGGKGLSREEIRNLEDLALKLFRRKPPRILFEKGIDENILDRAAKVGVAYRWDESRYSFLHLTLQEYFAACSLRSLGREEWKEIIREKKNAVAWHEIIQLFASILNEEEEYEELKILFSMVLESPDILHLNYALAGHCLAEIDMDDVHGSDEVLRDVLCEFEKDVCRKFFLKSLIHLGDKTINHLIDLLERTNNNDIKKDTVWSLGEIKDPKAADPLIDLLERTDDDNLRGSIAWSLGKIKSCMAVDPLINLLERTDNDYLKIDVSWALGKIGDPRAVDPLINILKETDNNDLKESVLWALVGVGDKNLESLIDLFERIGNADLRETISESLGRIGDEAVDPLIDCLEKAVNDYVRMGVSRSLGKIKNPKAVDPLINLLERTENNDLKMSIAWSLGEIKDPKAVDPLIDLLGRTDDDNLRGSIAWSLGKIKSCMAVDPLINLLERTENNDLKMSIARSLGEIKDPRAVNPLIDLLERTDDDNLRMSISVALRKVEDKAVRPLIDLLERANNDDLKKRIVWALGIMKDSRAVDPLIDLLKETDNDDLKKRIVWALARIGDSRAVDPLINLLGRTDNASLRIGTLAALRYMGDKVVDPLIDLLERTENSDLKKSIAWPLGEIKDPRAVDPLINLLKETDNDDLKKRIVWALARIGDPRAVDPLINLLKETDNDDLKKGTIRSLGILKDSKAVDPLIDLLKETDNDDLKETIVLFLGRMKDPKAVEPLIELLERTDNEKLKRWISWALGSIEDPRGIGPLIDLSRKTHDYHRRIAILGSLKKFNPVHLYPFLKKKELRNIIIEILCHFSTEYHMRFFKDKIVLPEGEVLHIETECQREQSIKRLDKIIKS